MSDWQWIFPLLESPLGRWLEQLPGQVESVWRERPHGDLGKWRDVIANLPTLALSGCRLDQPCVTAGRATDCDDTQRERIAALLQQLHPWRKGPYEICGLHIDTEWRSDWKWERIRTAIQPLQDRLVLDVGCGNGYHGWRMLGAGARQVIGIDPTQLFVLQFAAMRHFLGAQHPLRVLPLGIADPVSYTHLTLPTTKALCRSRWSPYH